MLKRKSNENTKGELLINFPNKYSYEFIYIPIFLILFAVYKFGINPNISHLEIAGRIRTAVFALLFGGFHFFASNILSYMYNLQHILMPFIPPISSPKRLKIFGIFIVLIGLVGLFRQ